MKSKIFPILLAVGLFPLLFNSCKKDTTYVYNVNDVAINKTGANKPNVKSTFEFISIAYSDLYNTTVSQPELASLGTAYAGFGDLRLVEEMIIKNLLNKPGVIIPGNTEMRNDVPLFMKNTYKKFFGREPNEFELWHFTNLITNDNTITPELVYFAIMTSNEYRYY